MTETKISEFARNKIMNFTINGKKVVSEIDLSNWGMDNDEKVIDIVLNDNFHWNLCGSFISSNVTECYSDLRAVKEVPDGLTFDEFVDRTRNS